MQKQQDNSLEHPDSSQDLLTVVLNVWYPSALCVLMLLYIFSFLES